MIARLVFQWCELLGRPTDPVVDARNDLAFEKAHRLQRALAELDAALADILERVTKPVFDDPAITRLVDLWNAVRLAEPYIGPPPKQGPQLNAWQVVARALEEPVRSALASAGSPRASIKAEGPLVRIIRSALEAIYAEDHSPEAIASILKTRRRKRGTQ